MKSMEKDFVFLCRGSLIYTIQRLRMRRAKILEYKKKRSKKYWHMCRCVEGLREFLWKRNTISL